MDRETELLFHELADLPPTARDALFAERSIPAEVRAELEALLRFDAEIDHVLTESVAGAAEHALHAGAEPQQQDAQCGPYRLVRRLGSGGMGDVYLAERGDGEIRQQAAVKLLHAGAERGGWRDRFLKERELLASLNHPSITRVIDAGHTNDGRPYLVMEYVDGVPIDVYASKLGYRDQLGLFLRVCEGVSHAHARLIVHRDLKPSNILVDASGQPKLLDFGIAKLLDETGERTVTAERLLTPAYASPEQLRGENQTTATDVYSLGAVLYKLLTGNSPHQPDAGATQAMAVITGAKTIPPPSRLNPSLPRDIDYIVSRALRPEPDERYASVEALGNDIRAFLDSRPVEARSGNAWYRTRKFVRRHWVPVGAAALIIASLSVGMYVANRERAIAQRRFSQLRQLSNRVFDLDNAIRNLDGSADARRKLVTTSLEYLEGLRSQALGDLDLAQELASGYLRLARVQGVPSQLNLGEFAQAEESLKKADALIERVLAARPTNRNALWISAGIAHDRMILADSERRDDDALKLARKAGERVASFLRQGNAAEGERTDAATLLANTAQAYINMHRYGDGIQNARRCMDIVRPIPVARRVFGGCLSLLSNALRSQGDLEAGLEAIQEARRLVEGASSDGYTRISDLYAVLLREGMILGQDGGISLDRPAEASAAFQRAMDITEASAQRNPGDFSIRTRVSTAGRELGNVLWRRDPERALAAYDLAIQRLAEAGNNNLKSRRDWALTLARSSYALRSLHRTAEGRRRVDAALKILKETKDYPAERISLDSEVYEVRCALAAQQAGEGQTRAAIETYGEVLDKVMLSKPNPLDDLRDATKLSGLYETMTGLYRQDGDSADAATVYARRLELWRHWGRKLPANSFVLRQLAAAAN